MSKFDGTEVYVKAPRDAVERYEHGLALARTIMCTGAYIGGAALLTVGLTGHVGFGGGLLATVCTLLGGIVVGWTLGIGWKGAI